LRQTHKDLTTSTTSVLSSLASQLARVRAAHLERNDRTAARAALDSGRTKMTTASTHLSTRATALRSVVDALALDVGRRRARPDPGTVRALTREATDLSAELTEFAAFVDAVRPSWKKVWEDELQGIVAEQAFLKAQDAVVADVEDGIADLGDVLETVRAVIALR
ncbi:actin interacting protein 3, partial [Blyttiomyces helicus]